MDHHENRLVWIAWAIIVGLLGSTASFVGPNLVQALVLQTGNTLYINTPTLANLVFFVGIIFLVLFCIFMYLSRKWATVLAIFSLVVAGVLLFASSTNYSIITKQKFEEKPLFQLSGSSYEWEEITDAKMVIKNMKTGEGNLVVFFKDGKEIVFDKNKYLDDNLGMIKKLMLENGVTLTNTYSETAVEDSE